MIEKEKRTEIWIKIYTPDGETRIASPSYIGKLLGIPKTRMNLYNRLEMLERRVDRVESPGRQEEILKLLRENGKHNLLWISNRVINYKWYDLDFLLKAGLIVKSKAGTVTMYSCTRAKDG